MGSRIPSCAVDQELLRQHVQDALVGRNRHCLGGIDDVLDIAMGHFAVADRDHSVRIEAAHVAAGDAGVDRVDLAVRHQLGLLDRALDRLHRRLDVDDHALLQAARRLAAHADDLDRTVGRDLADQREHLGGADVQSDDDVFVDLLSQYRALLVPASLAPRGSPPSSRLRNRCRSADPRRRCLRRAASRAWRPPP